MIDCVSRSKFIFNCDFIMVIARERVGSRTRVSSWSFAHGGIYRMVVSISEYN